MRTACHLPCTCHDPWNNCTEFFQKLTTNHLSHLPVRHRCVNNWELDALYDTINYLINPVSVVMTSPGVIRCSGSSFSTFCFFNREHASFISTAILRMLLPFTNGFLKSAIPTFQSANHFRYGFSGTKWNFKVKAKCGGTTRQINATARRFRGI